jgi:aryl-alcohol dehydrogenase-like predicted oxidoreductase
VQEINVKFDDIYLKTQGVLPEKSIIMENRRNFLKKLASITPAIMVPIGWGCRNAGPAEDKLGPLLPMRKLGKTGEKVTMLGVGGYHIGWTTEKDAREVIETAIEGGIRFFDTAHNYVQGLSEERYGKYLVPKYREHIFLMTKTQAGDGESLLKEVELSLSRLKTDRVDLLQLHSFRSPKDVDDRISNGVMDAILSLKESGKARYIGFTGHQSPYAHLRMLERMHEFPGFSTLQMPISTIDFLSEHSFVRQTLPVALEHGLGLLAMKTLADGRFFGKKQVNDMVLWETDKPVIPDCISVRDTLFFSWSLPISVLITGAENKELVSEKIQLARDFVKLTGEERDQILEKAGKAPDRTKVEYYKNIID